MALSVDEWIDRVLARADELRAKGVSSIGVDGYAASFLAKEPDLPADEADANPQKPYEEPLNAWEDPNSYPGGFVPTLEIDDLRDERR